MKIPVVNLSDCNLCGGCVDVCPSAFRLNNLGFIEVIELPSYPEEEVDEAIKYCPKDCVLWETDD